MAEVVWEGREGSEICVRGGREGGERGGRGEKGEEREEVDVRGDRCERGGGEEVVGERGGGGR